MRLCFLVMMSEGILTKFQQHALNKDNNRHANIEIPLGLNSIQTITGNGGILGAGDSFLPEKGNIS